MKISAIETTPVYVPRLRAFGAVTRTALGPADVSEHGIVQVRTDEGLTGLGELSSVFARRGPLLCRDVDERLAPVLVGRSPLDITSALRAMETQLPDGQLAIAGVEMALWDLAGKALGVPVYTLLGGRMRDRIPLSYSIPHGEPEQMAEFALERAGQGFRTVKVKTGQGMENRRGGGAPGSRSGRLRPPGAGRRQHGDAQRQGRDFAWSSGSWNTTRRCSSSRCPRTTCRRWPRSAARCRFPSWPTSPSAIPGDAMEVIRREAADVLNVYVTESGGIQNAARIFILAEQAGLGCLIGSMPELGIGTAAQIHLGIAMPNLDFDSDTCGSLYQAEDLLATPLRFEGGFAFAPEGPGLGVELDAEAFERAAKRSPPQ